MCGRFTLTTSGEALARFFDLGEVPLLAPRYNIAPTQLVLAVRRTAGEEKRQAVFLRWGLIPSWAKDAQIANQLINARSETAADKPAFRTALRRRRCLIPADGFYEWLREGKKRQPYCFRLWGDGLFAFAGLWEHWTDPAGAAVETCTILTTEANDLVRPVHERMPVILRPRLFASWLDAALQDPGSVTPLLRPYPAEEMRGFPVSPWVSDPRHEDPRCLTALA
jgi:putative SOS response-associated peptidase YedK